MLISNRHLIAGACVLLLIANLTVHASGAGSQVWGMDREELSFRLQTGDYEFLRNTDLSSSGLSVATLRQARRLGDDAFHMLGLIYEELDLQLSAERLFTLSWNEGTEPWRRDSLLELLRILDTGERYSELESLAKAGRDRYGDDLVILRHLINALYRQEKSAEVMTLSVTLDELITSAGSGDSVRSELALWLAVSSSRLGLPGWEDRYRELFANHRADHAHYRVWVYLQANPGIASRFSPMELLFFEAKQMLAEGRSVDAVEGFSEVADKLIAGIADEATTVVALLLSPLGLRDFYLAGSISGRQSATAARMIGIADVAPDDIARRALEYAGRLYRTSGNNRLAVQQFERSLLIQPAGPDSERVRWYLLSSQTRLDPVGTAGSLAAVTPTLGDPAYYGDLFAELASLLAGRERWDALLQAYQAIRDFSTPGTRATYELVLAEVIGRGALPTNPLRRASLRAEYLQRAAAQTEDLFSALVASALLGQSGESVLDAALVSGAAIVADEGRDGALSGVESAKAKYVEQLLRSLLRYGLLDRAYAIARKESGLTRSGTMTQLSDRLAERGRIREAIQIAVRVTPGGETLHRLYPLGFVEVFDEVLKDESVDRWILFALVREESLFDPEIVSGAGAVGLTQLLSATADDVARRMRIAPPDLTDPLQNLRVGARYLSMLDAQFGGLVKALAAYNAGQGRVREWERQRPELDGVLFHQAIPYQETYNHLRKIVVSAVYYGYLYQGRSPTDTIRVVFRDLQTVGE